MHLQKSKKKFLEQPSITEKNIITHFITHFITHMVNSIKWNSNNYNVVIINFNRFFVVFNSYLKIVQWFESV